MKWNKVTESLPEIPKGKHGVSVLVCTYDPIFDELCSDCTKSNGKGLSVNKYVSYTIVKEYSELPDFYEQCTNDDWIPLCEQIICWMYLPSPPEYTTEYDKLDDCLRLKDIFI